MPLVWGPRMKPFPTNDINNGCACVYVHLELSVPCVLTLLIQNDHKCHISTKECECHACLCLQIRSKSVGHCKSLSSVAPDQHFCHLRNYPECRASPAGLASPDPWPLTRPVWSAHASSWDTREGRLVSLTTRARILSWSQTMSCIGIWKCQGMRRIYSFQNSMINCHLVQGTGQGRVYH